MGANLSLSIDTRGLQELTQEVRQLGGQVVRGSAENIRARAVDAIHDGPKTGRIYGAETAVSFTTKDGKSADFTAHRGRKLGDDKVHQASAPGEAPANDEGNLAASIHTEHVSDLASEVVVGAAYGDALEHGTEDGKIAPRPFMEPSVEAERPIFEQAMGAVLQRAAR